MMARLAIAFAFMFLFVTTTCAQEIETVDGDLIAVDTVISTEQDIFGQEIQTVRGVLVNQGDTAYTGIDLFADLYNAEDEIIGEGFGQPVNACGTGLLPDFVLYPNDSQPFSLTLELFEDDDIERIEIIPEGQTSDDERPDPVEIPVVHQISDREVVAVEWEDAGLIYGAGCDADVFTRLDWFRLADGETDSIDHPDAENITPELLEALALSDPFTLNRSYLTFSPTANRLIYQDDINAVFTAEPNGDFRRLIYDNLSRFSLHGFIWLPEGRFLAYYYGAFGDDVRYYTANVAGQRISADIFSVTPSATIPGPTPDGARAVITTTVDGVTGYYIKQTLYGGIEFLFEAEPPGNNWPAPIFDITDAREAFIYFVRPLDGTPTLQCLNRQTGDLVDLTELPLKLDSDSRAWTWLSPDRSTMAVAQNGVNGGLWLVDLPACE